MAKVRRVGNQFVFLCPGCGVDHRFNDKWTFNGDLDRPTITPGLKTAAAVAYKEPGNDEILHRSIRCWADITDGRITFREWSSHALVGQTVDLPDIPEPAPAAPGMIGA